MEAPHRSGYRRSEHAAAEQTRVTRRYDRAARFYDVYDAPMEWMGVRSRRARLWKKAEGRILEIGVGTGKNLTHYPAGSDVTGIDVSEKMLHRARRKQARLEIDADLRLADAMSLPFEDDSFDTAIATCVFCSVADPVAGISEMGRVTRPGGRILLLEHVRPRSRVLGWMADLVTVVTRRLFGFRANRRTEKNVAAAGLRLVTVAREGIWRLIEAAPPDTGRPDGDVTP